MPSDNDCLLHCDGWWEQIFFGRQPMKDLVVSIEADRIQGRGSDVVGPFVLEGLFSSDGSVALSKHYVGRHSVRYLGKYDGEGTMAVERCIRIVQPQRV